MTKPMPTPELIDSAQKALSAMTRQPRDSEEEYYWRCAVVNIVLKAHEEWLAEQRSCPDFIDRAQKVLSTLPRQPRNSEEEFFWRVSVVKAISAALQDSEHGSQDGKAQAPEA